MTGPFGSWNYPTHMTCGAGLLTQLPAHCRSLAMRRPLLVTDPAVEQMAFTGRAVDLNGSAGILTEVFSSVRANPIGANVEAGVRQFIEGGHDGIIALGGGSVTDTAKAIALMTGQDRPLWDFEDSGDNWKRADPAGICDVIAIPTTAGTGSEVGRAALIINEAEERKVIIFHPAMSPRRVILDPELTLDLPANLTAATGMDALAHCFEAYSAPGYHPMADGIAVEGMRLIAEYLPRVFKDGSDLVARTHMLSAASMGATAFQKGLGAIHALSHPVGAIFNTHHGLTNAVFHPYVMQFNRPAIDARMERLAAWLQLPGTGFSAVLEWVLELRLTLGIPHRLSDLGITQDRGDDICAMAVVDPTAATNPLPLDIAAARQIFDASMVGRL